MTGVQTCVLPIYGRVIERICSLLELALRALELPARTEDLKIHSKAMTLRARFTSTTPGLDAWKRTTVFGTAHYINDWRMSTPC